MKLIDGKEFIGGFSLADKKTSELYHHVHRIAQGNGLQGEISIK